MAPVRHLVAAGVALGLVFLAYASAPAGAFVHDDRKQILENQPIQDPARYAEALLSDVWAFKGGGVWSQYWRPTFVAWMILHWRLFGPNPAPWHWGNLLLHAAASLLAYRALLVLGSGWPLASVVTWLFAAHPVHVESVAWIAGAPDLLMTCGLLGSYLLYLSARAAPSKAKAAGVVLLYLVAQLAKEVAIVFPAILAATEWILARSEGVARAPALRRALASGAPAAAAGAAFLLVRRFAVLGFLRLEVQGAPSFGEALLTVPSLVAFYLRQTFFPVELGPQYGLRVVTTESAGLGNLWMPLAALAAIVAAAASARGDRMVRLGAVWFLLPLATALDVRSFRPEDLVHDRYLYLPLLGALLVGGRAAERLASRAAPERRVRAGLLAAGAVLSVGAAVLAQRYVPVWGEEIALWRRGVAVDPRSSFAHAQLGEALRKAGRIEEARASLEAALAIEPRLLHAHLGLGAIAVAEKRFADAERYLRDVLATYPDSVEARDRLSLSMQQQGRLDEAIALLDEGRGAVPHRRGVWTVNIAVLEKLAGRPERAVEELESVRETMARSKEIGVARGWWLLALLYAESGRRAEAVAACDAFLRATEGAKGEDVLALRQTVLASRRELSGE